VDFSGGLAIERAEDAPGVLDEPALEGSGCGKEQGVEAGEVEAFPLLRVGRDRQTPNRDRRRRVGYVPQNLGLYLDMTLTENIIGATRALAVRTGDWATAFAALNAANVPVTLDGRAVRVADTSPDEVRRVLGEVGIDASVEAVPATIEERMLVLDRTAAP
jgi:hypothetical protein